MTKEQKRDFLTIAGVYVTTVGTIYTVVVGSQIGFGLWGRVTVTVVPAIILIPFWFFGRGTAFYRRLYLTLSGASKVDYTVDILRFISLVGVAVIIVRTHGTRLLQMQMGLLFLFFLLFIYFHAFVYPLIRTQSKWDVEYKKRKLMLFTAIDYAAACVAEHPSKTRIYNIEINALRAIKSFLEYSVFDLAGTSFNVNLLVMHPTEQGSLVCITRANPGKRIPTIYEEGTMLKARETLQTGIQYYEGNYSNPSKDYRTVWHIPIQHPLRKKDNEYVGLLCIDSQTPRHLNFSDERASLFLALTPYIALLEYALSLRMKHNIWDDLE
jgi:hypothetical protein